MAATHDQQSRQFRNRGKLGLPGRWAGVLPAALLPAVHFVIASGLENIYGNRMEFEFGMGAALPSLLSVALAVVAVLCLLGAVLPAAARSRYIAVIFALGFLGWLQSSFLPGDYGQLTGETIDWSRNALQGRLDLALWLVGLAAALRYHRALRPVIRFVAPMLVALELLGLGARVLLAPAEAPPPEQHADAASLARFSSTRNVLHILMDGFQTDVFLELAAEEGLEDDLDGFTVFTENSAVAPYTAMNLPAVFSGDVYDGGETPAEYHHRALRRNGFHHRLKDEGYAVHLIPKIPMHGDGYTLYAETPHLYGLSRSARLRHQVAFLCDLGLFRSSPHLLRRVIHNDGNWRLSSVSDESSRGLNSHQRAFFADYIDRMEVVYDEPAYHFVHLMPPHGPFVTLPDGSDAGRTLPNTRENYKIEAHYILQLFLDLLERMRGLGVYDSALIVLHADHGLGEVTRAEGDTRRMVVPRAPALLAVKRIGGHGPLARSEAPTTIADIPATILGELGLAHERAGRSVFDLKAGEPRTRYFNTYSLGAGSKGKIRRFQLDGSVYDAQAWRPLRDRVVDLGRPDYVWGDRVEFGVGSDSDRYLGANWSSGGAGGGRMNLRKRGGLTLKAPPTPQAVEAVFEIRPRLREGETRRFGVRLTSRGVVVGERKFEQPRLEAFAFRIPAGHAAGGKLDLEFEFVEYGAEAESMAWALCLVSMRLEPVQE